MSAGRALLDDLVTTLFPADCSLCHQPLARASRAPVCEACIARLVPQESAVCLRCGNAIAEAIGMEDQRFARQLGSFCIECRLVPPPFERAVAFGVYADELRGLIHLLKYDRMPAVARPLGLALSHAIDPLEMRGEVTMVAVPLFPAKQRQRGYNQAVLIAGHACAALRGRPNLTLTQSHSLLRRVRDTESQFALSSNQRRRNLRGAFAIADPDAVKGRTILLVDDIYTTGATARECARVLAAAGAARIVVATVARAQTERAELWQEGTAENSVARWTLTNAT